MWWLKGKGIRLTVIVIIIVSIHLIPNDMHHGLRASSGLRHQLRYDATGCRYEGEASRIERL